MAIVGIPSVGTSWDSFQKGFHLTDNLMQQIQQRRQLQQQADMERLRQQQAAEQFKQRMALSQQQFARSGQNDALRRQIMLQDLQHKKNIDDPNYELNKIKKISEAFGGDFEKLKNNPIAKGFIKHQYGIDLDSKTPEELQNDKLNLFKKEQEIKSANKKQELEDQEISAVKKDLPALNKSLSSVRELLSIAKNNPEMFGHNFMPDRFAKTTKIKDFGKWQNLISDAISGLEQKLSSKGNIVALKMAANLKPSHAEQQEVAIGKLESMEKQLLDSINHSREVAGLEPLQVEENNVEQKNTSQYSDEQMVRVKTPNGIKVMTYAQAKQLGAK